MIRLCIAVAGGGFTMFLLGYVQGTLPSGVKVGGPLGVFVLLFFLTPANEIKVSLNENLNKCETNLESRSDLAEAYCEQAVKDLPDEPRPMFLLGTAQSNLGKYREAINSWTKALTLGAEPALTHYNIACAQYQLGDYEAATKSASIAAGEAADNDGLQTRSWYLIADAERALWKVGQGDDVHFINARDKYLAFIEKGSPTYKAEANLACLLGAKASLTSDAAAKSALEDQALAHFDRAIAAIKAYSGPEDSTKKMSFVAAFRPGNGCGKTLADLWTRKRPEQNYESAVLSAQD